MEYVPLTLLMFLLAELQKAPPLLIPGFGIALILSRILHAAGLSRSGGYSLGRFYGTLGTWLVMIGLAVHLIWKGLS